MLNMSLDSSQSRLQGDLKELAIRLRKYAREAEEAGDVPAAVRTALIGFGLPGTDGFASGTNDPVSFCLAAESLAWSDAGIAYAWLASRQVAWIISACGTDSQKSKWLPRFAQDPFMPASLYMYEGHGFAASEVATEIRRNRDKLLINGYKSPVMYPKNAAVSVIVGHDESGSLAAVLTEDLGGAVTFDTGEPLRRLGMTACPSALEARIANLAMPASAAMSSDSLLQALTTCRMAHAAVCIGTAAAATRYAAEYAKTRVAFGKPIIGFQGVSFVLTDLFIEAEVLHLSMLEAVTADVPPQEREQMASRVMAATNQLVADSSREGVQILGAAGILMEHPQERVYRNAPILGSIDFDPLHSELAVR
jgi:alkylation response protein AidB-like acyl-CoA dehydrogenase